MVKNSENQLSKLRRIFKELVESQPHITDPQAAVDFLWACIYLERSILELEASRKAQEKSK